MKTSPNITPLKKRVAVLLPNYNNALFLKECLDSIFSQSFQDFSIVIVDDASTDKSVSIVESYNDSRLILIKKDINSGIVDTLNKGLSFVNSEYILRMDGDDIMHPDRIKILVDFMDKNPHIGICSSDIITFGYKVNEIIFERDLRMNKANLIFCHSIGHASSIFRASLFFENGISYNNDYPLMEDYDLFYRLKDLTQMTSIPAFLYEYRLFERHADKNAVADKEKTYKNFYHRILLDIGLDGSKEEIQIHFELSKNVIPSFKLWQYKAHIKKLQKINQKKKTYPHVELTAILKKSYICMVYRMVEINKVGFVDSVIQSIYCKRAVIYFWAKRKIMRSNS